MPTIIIKVIAGSIAAVLIWSLFWSISRLASNIKHRKRKPIELSFTEKSKGEDNKKHSLLLSSLLIIVGIIIGMVATILYVRHISVESKSKSDEIEATNSISSGWKKIHKVDVFGDNTNDTYFIYKFTMHLPTGIRGGALPSAIVIDESKENSSYAIVISPNSSNQPEEDYGLYLKLWYKEEGGTQSQSMLKFQFHKGVGYVPDLMSLGIIHKWRSKHKKVRFKGFTTDSETTQEFEDSPNGIGRKGADVFLNPDFFIQF